MLTFIRSAEIDLAGANGLGGFELPADFQMPTAEEIEHDLELSKPGWKSLLRSSEGEPDRAYPSRFPRVLILVALIALSAVFWGEASTAAGPTTSSHFIWTARGPIPADGLINPVTAVTLNDGLRP